MKAQIKMKSFLTVLSVIMILSMLLGIMSLIASATEASPEWVDDYTVEASCDNSGTTLGNFNGSSACIDATTGDLHYCTANFPYLYMATHIYYFFTHDSSASVAKREEALNTDIFMDLETALNVLSINVSTVSD